MKKKITQMNRRNGEQLLLFKIPTSNGSVQMCLSEVLKDKFVVFVDPKKYLKMWENSPYVAHQKYAIESKKEWLSNGKYSNIDKEMNNTFERPVHLIEIDAALKTKKYFKIPFSKYYYRFNSVGFQFKDGITRSMWLLINKAQFIPVVCFDKKSARLMSTFGKHGNDKVYTFDQLATLAA